MKILAISTNIFPIPLVGYGGVEQMCYYLAEGLAKKGHQVSVVCPEGSRFEGNLEPIFTGLREDEEKSWQRYKGRLEAGEWEVIVDSSWQRWSMMSSAGRDPQLPIVNWHHTHESVYHSLPPVRYSMWTGLSKSHAENLSLAYKVPVRFVYNGIDTQFYKNNGRPRGGRFLFMGRYTPEKAPLELIMLAKKLKIGLDLYGDTEIVGNQDYVRRCFQEADGYFVRVYPGISREATVDAYSTHQALLQWLAWEEPFGLVVLEAQACGLVPIVARRGAMPEVIKDGETGFTVDNLDEMAKIIETEKFKEVNQEVMRRWVEEKFSLGVFVDAWEKLLQAVVKGERW